MKTNTLLRTMLLVVMVAFGAPAFADAVVPVHAAPVETQQEHLQRLERRLEEIKSMDIDKLSRSEKKELRREVRAIKKEMKAVSGVYISIGALLIIILLIVLLA
jgi:hypothetical protein